jgi:hypothetical protein
MPIPRPQPGKAHMMFSATVFFRLVAACGLLSAGGQLILLTGEPNQQSGQATPHVHKVTGMVVNAATGAGVPKALVQTNTTSGQTSVLTGSDGRFEIDDVPEGAANFMPRKPGYFNEQEMDQGSGPQRMITVGESTPDIQLKLFPEGVIEGSVLDEAGEPVEGAGLQALFSQVREGRRRWEQVSGNSTDDTGTYRLANLRPGQYLVYVNAGGSRGRKPGENLDLVFAPAFYPGAATPGEATRIAISAGQHVQADFSLKRQPGYMVSGVVTNLPQGSGAGISATPAGAAYAASMQTGAGTKPNGEFRLGPFPEGEYVLQAQAQSGQITLWQEIRLTIGHANVTNLQLALDQPYEIPMQLTVVRTNPAGQAGGDGSGSFISNGPASGRAYARHLARGVQLGNITFNSEDNPPSSQYVPLHEQTEEQNEPLVVKGLRPGTYHMNSGGNRDFYVESARCGDTDLLEAPLVIHTGVAPPPIQITLRDDGANLTVNCTKDAKNQNCAVLLAPTHGQPTFYPYVSGVFINGLAPGEYRAYAFDYAADLEYANPEAMRDYSSKGQDFTLEVNDQKTITLEVIHRDAPGTQSPLP